MNSWFCLGDFAHMSAVCTIFVCVEQCFPALQQFNFLRSRFEATQCMLWICECLQGLKKDDVLKLVADRRQAGSRDVADCLVHTVNMLKANNSGHALYVLGRVLCISNWQ